MSNLWQPSSKQSPLLATGMPPHHVVSICVAACLMACLAGICGCCGIELAASWRAAKPLMQHLRVGWEGRFEAGAYGELAFHWCLLMHASTAYKHHSHNSYKEQWA